MNYILPVVLAKETKILINKLAYGTCKKGFGLLELLMVLLLTSIIGQIAIPQFSKLIPRNKKQEFIARLNGLVAIAYRSALAHQAVQKITFKLEDRTITHEELQSYSPEGTPLFKTVDTPLSAQPLTWDVSLEMKKFFINGVDYLAKQGIKTELVWFYVAPSGIAQEVGIEFLENSSAPNEAEKIYLELNPFSVQFSQTQGLVTR